ncbi:MAG: hypothetical protein MSC31_18040 [Solirubrobacteraceae bacterium MAG38_C4-C5]|nr:hypothetical protein [Candidatus Siliceabacter maunaloa]
MQIRDRPLLLVDIDGVISLWGFLPAQAPAGAWCTVDGILHFLSAAAADHLRALGERFDLVWCSGWEEKANEYLPHAIGLGPLPHVTFETAPGEQTAHWKLHGIDAHALERPLAWIDDAHERWPIHRDAPDVENLRRGRRARRRHARAPARPWRGRDRRARRR